MGNFKSIVSLALFSLILAGCTKEDPNEHLKKGIEYFNEGEYEKAILELKTSSQSDTKLAETYYYLALLDEKNRQYKAMKENLKKVIELSPTHVDARLKLGKVQLLLGEPDAAIDQAETILKESNQNLDAQLLKASALMRQKKQTEAQAIVDSVLKENPNHVDGLMLKSFIHMENKNIDNALALINTAIAHDPKNVSLRLYKIQLNARNKNIDAIINDYQELIALDPNNQEFKITLAKIYAQAGKKNEAQNLLKDLIDMRPKDINLKLILLSFLKTSYPEKVNDQFQNFIELYKENSKVLVTFATWAIAQQNIGDAKSTLNRVIELNKDKNQILLAKVLLGKIAFNLKDFDAAKKIAEEILSKNPNSIDAKLLQTRLLLKEAKYEEAIDLLTKILWDEPNSEEAVVLLGQTFLSKGNEKEAEKQFKKALEINPANLEALTYLYANALAVNNLGYAQEITEKALRYQPENLFLLEKAARAYISAKMWDSANRIVQKIETLTNSQANTLAKFLQAKIYQGQGECVKAIDLYKDSAISASGNYEVLAGMARCYENINKKSSMIAFLNDLLSKNSLNIAANVVLSDLLVSDKQFEKSASLLTNLINKNDKIPEYYAALAKVKLAQGDNKAAISIYEEGIKKIPGNTTLLLSLAALYDKQGGYDSAISIYESLLKNNPDFEVAANNLAAILTEHGSGEESLTKAIKLSEKLKNSKHAYYRDTYAWALIKQGNINEGMERLNQIVNSEPEVPVFRYHLAVAHYKNANNWAAISELREALDLAKKQGGFSDQKAAESLLNEIMAKTNQ